LAEANAAAAAELERLEQANYKVYVPSGLNPESYRAAYRDASFRLADLDDAALGRAMDRALRSDDGPVAQAAYHEALARGAGGFAEALGLDTPLSTCVQRYREKCPSAARRWERYAQLKQERENPLAMVFRAMSTSEH
jgi:hypothetical protein